MAIATARTGTESSLREKLKHTGFAEYISVVAPRHTQDSDWMNKQEQIHRICQTLNIKEENTAMVGDIPPDITSAQEAGVGFTVAVRSGGIDEEILRAARPDLLVQSVYELNHDLGIFS